MPSNRLKINCIVNVTTSWYEPLSKRTLNIVKEEKRGKIRVHIKNVKIETSKTEGFSWQKLVVHLCIYNTLAVWRHESWHELRHDFRHNRIRIYEGRNQDEEKKKPHLKHATREWCHIKPKIVMEQEWFCRIKFVRDMKVRAIGRCFLLIPRFFFLILLFCLIIVLFFSFLLISQIGRKLVNAKRSRTGRVEFLGPGSFALRIASNFPAEPTKEFIPILESFHT